MAYFFNPPKRCSAEWETEDSLGEQVPAGHAAEGLLRARSRGQAAAETDCRERRCKLLFRSQREAAWAKVRQKMRKETSYSSLVASFLKAGFREDKVRVASSPKKGDLPQAPELQPATILSGASEDEAKQKRCTGLRREEAFATHPCAVDGEGAATASSSSRWQAFRWGSWVDVDSVMQKALVQAADHGDPKVAFSNDNVPYIADLARMVLLNEKTGRKRILRFDPGDQANQAPKLPTLGQTGTTSWLSGSRCQVFVEGSGWKAMSIDNGATQTSLQGAWMPLPAESGGLRVHEPDVGTNILYAPIAGCLHFSACCAALELLLHAGRLREGRAPRRGGCNFPVAGCGVDDDHGDRRG